MPIISDSNLKGMLKNIADPGVRATYESIINGKFPYQVFCMNPLEEKHKPGLLIGYIDLKGKCVDEPTHDKKTGEPVAGIETSRDRLDGRKGFKCYCGNDSVIAPEEKGILDRTRYPVPPSKDDLNAVFENIRKSKKEKLILLDGEAVYDGFKIAEFTG